MLGTPFFRDGGRSRQLIPAVFAFARESERIRSQTMDPLFSQQADDGGGIEATREGAPNGHIAQHPPLHRLSELMADTSLPLVRRRSLIGVEREVPVRLDREILSREIESERAGWRQPLDAGD